MQDFFQRVIRYDSCSLASKTRPIIRSFVQAGISVLIYLMFFSLLRVFLVVCLLLNAVSRVL